MSAARGRIEMHGRTIKMLAGLAVVTVLAVAPGAAADPRLPAGMFLDEGGNPAPRELLSFRRERIVEVGRSSGGRTAVLGTRVYRVPLDVRVLDPNGSVRSADYLARGMEVYFRYRQRADGPPVLTEVRVIDASTDFPES